MNVNALSEKYFLHWQRVSYKKCCEIQDELVAEAVFAMNNDMETEFWCWNCKHSECERHKLKYKIEKIKKVKKSPCAGKTQRGRDCHINATTYRNGLFLCKYHF